MAAHNRRISTHEEYIQAFKDNKRIWIDEDLNRKNSGQFGNWIDRVIHPDATSQKGADVVGVAETKAKEHGHLSGTIEVCSFVKSRSNKEGLEEAFEKIKDGLGIVTYKVSKGTHTHVHPIIGEMSIEKDCLDLVELHLYRKCIPGLFKMNAKIISKSDNSKKVQLRHGDIKKCFESYEVITL